MDETRALPAVPPIADAGAGPSDAPMSHEELVSEIHQLSPAEARELHDEFVAGFHAPPPPPTLEQCRDGRDAQIRLSVLTSDKDWIARFLAGGFAEKAEFHTLTEMVAAAADEGGFIKVGEVETVMGDFGVARRDLIDSIADLGKTGIPPEGIERIVVGNWSDEDVAFARSELARLTATPSWREALVSGDPEARHQMRAWSAIIGSRRVL
jgi:hypothetical protein